MGEPEGRADEGGVSETGALPEGAAIAGRGSADPPQRVDMPAFPTQPRGSADLNRQSLDMTMALDEPEQLVRELLDRALEQQRESVNPKAWKVLIGHFHAAGVELERMNELPAKR
jgi:hypothetical protein